MSSPATSQTGLSAHLVLASRFENIEVAERALLDLCQQAGCCGDDEYWLVTALREAMANAIRHGNRQDPELVVDVRYRVLNCAVEIRIEDQGSGFDLDQVPDPTDAANLLRPSGRGIFYMRQFMSRVDFQQSDGGGTVVTMARELAPTKESTS